MADELDFSPPQLSRSVEKIVNVTPERLTAQSDLGGVSSTQRMELEKRLAQWIKAKCLELNPRPQRVMELNHGFQDIYRDRRFWSYRTSENAGFYEEALSCMWVYFTRNLCTVTTARNGLAFVDTRNYAVGRLLVNLKGHLKNIEKQQQKQRNRQEDRRDEEGNPLDVEEYIPNVQVNQATLVFECFLHLLETDPTGELQAKENCLRGKSRITNQPYELTAQTYLLMRYRDDKTIQQIADELDIPRGSLQGGAKPTRWKALERKLAEMAREQAGE